MSATRKSQITGDKLVPADSTLKLIHAGEFPHTYEEDFTAIDFTADSDIPNKKAVVTWIGAANVLQQIQIANASTNQVQAFSAGSFITYILVKKVSGAPSLDIGTTNGGGEILPISPITSFTPINADYYFNDDGNLYFNISGGGSVNIYIYYLNNLV